MFSVYLKLWGLVPDGHVIKTHSSQLLPVLRGDTRLMLKVAEALEERRGGALLARWQVGPFVEVFAQSGDAVVMARADESPSLLAMAETGEDRAATLILCDIAAQIHDTSAPVADLIPLKTRFKDLWSGDGAAFDPAKRVARDLLDEMQQVKPLHGDLHHGNVLHFGRLGWLAIDPKGVLGEPGFDYANMFCNPTPDLALKPGRFEDQIEIIASASGITKERLCKWVVAWTGLSAVWSMQSQDDPKPALEIGRLASANLP